MAIFAGTSVWLCKRWTWQAGHERRSLVYHRLHLWGVISLVYSSPTALLGQCNLLKQVRDTCPVRLQLVKGSLTRTSEVLDLIRLRHA